MTGRPRNRREVWNVRERPMRARLRAGAPVTSEPNSSTVPALGGNSPEMRLNSVVLPAPFGPRIARRSPGRTSRSTALTAWTPPKRRPTPRRWRIGAARSADVAGVATASLLRREVDLFGVADPRRGLAGHALRVGPVRSGRLGREDPVERLVDVVDLAERLHVRRTVTIRVLDDLLDVAGADRLAVVVELDVAPRSLVAAQGDARERLLELALVGDVAVHSLEALDQAHHVEVVAVREHRRA